VSEGERWIRVDGRRLRTVAFTLLAARDEGTHLFADGEWDLPQHHLYELDLPRAEMELVALFTSIATILWSFD
jgi:hypothetical protein